MILEVIIFGQRFLIAFLKLILPNDPEKLVWFLELSITDNRDQIISENYDKALSFYKETLNEIQDYLDLSNAFQYIGLGNTKLYITFIAEI